MGPTIGFCESGKDKNILKKTTIKIIGLVAILLLVTVIPAWASQGVGGSPYTADLLVSGLNTGELAPGEEYWYAYSRRDLGEVTYNAVILSLNYEAEGRAISSRVNFQVFDFEQVEAWLKDRSSPVDSLGLGVAASADFDVNTGERFWSGPVQSDKVYYVRIFNVSPSPVQFRLTAVGQKSAQIQEFVAAGGNQAAIPAAISVPGESETVAEVPDRPETASPPTTNSSIASQLPVDVNDNSPASTRWLLAAQAINGLPPTEAAAWLMSAATLGWLPGGSGSSAAIPTDPNAEVDGVAGGGSGEEEGGNSEVAVVAAPVDPSKGENIYPNQPVRLLTGANTGRMGPKTEQWYTFTAGNVDKKLIENFSLTMFFTPGEPNLARDVTFEMFTADQYPIWERGTPEQMAHFGAGSWVSRDGDYDTGERLWHGTVVDGGIYYIKLINETNKWVDYHLLTGDIYNIEMGEPLVNRAKPAHPEKAPTGKDIGSPLPIGKGIKTGRLAAESEIWFQFEHQDFKSDEVEFNNYLIELQHTPGHGYITNHVNVEIYPYQDQHIWRRGDTDLIKPLGAGSDFGYDKETKTQSWVWDGHFVSNTIYFIRVHNGSVQDIEYELLIRRK